MPEISLQVNLPVAGTGDALALIARLLKAGCAAENIRVIAAGVVAASFIDLTQAETVATQLRAEGMVCVLEVTGTGTPAEQAHFIDDLSRHIVAGANLSPLSTFDVRGMFREVFRRHSFTELETWAGQGFPGQVPDLAAVMTAVPNPWRFLRIFIFFALCGTLLFAGGTGDVSSLSGLWAVLRFVGAATLLMAGILFLLYRVHRPVVMLFAATLFLNSWAILALLLPNHEIENLKVLPGLILFGSFAAPVACLVFFHEMNVLRNISIYQVAKLFLAGGVASIALALFGFGQADGLMRLMGNSSAGVIEEIAKLATVIVVLRWTTERNGESYRFILNGLLIGAAVGAGFAAFESAGYAFEVWTESQGSAEQMISNLFLRGIMAPFAHVAWTAIFAGALWRALDGRTFSWKLLADPRFLRLAPFPILLHMFWNSSAQLPFMLKYLLIGIVAWTLLRALFEEGIRQVRIEQGKLALLVVRREP